MWAGYAAWHGASSSAWAPAACYALSVGAIWGWRRGRSCGAFCSAAAWCHIHWWRPSGCREGCVLGDTCAGGRVGVAALGRVPRARRQTMDDVDTGKLSVAAASHTRAAAASTATITLQQTQPLRRHRALQHGRPTRASYWRTPHAHTHCLELHVILLFFACIPACLAQPGRALYSR